MLSEISSKSIEVLLATHSSRIANADFIHKYLTISRCDLFFADKAILIEGAVEKLFIPDRIKNVAKWVDTNQRHHNDHPNAILLSKWVVLAW